VDRFKCKLASVKMQQINKLYLLHFLSCKFQISTIMLRRNHLPIQHFQMNCLYVNNLRSLYLCAVIL
jgi:hypothetical protein